MKTLIYLARPYTHADPAVMRERFRQANIAAARAMAVGKHIFSPISHTHPIAEEGNLPREWGFWEGYDRAILAACKSMVVLRLPGWETSKGVTAEIAIAREMGLPVAFIDF